MNFGIQRHLCWALLGVLLVALSACGPGPKSKQLVELERHLQDPEAREVKEAPGAYQPFQEARQYRRLALEAWEEGKDERSQEYALLGTLKYRTAVAIREQHEASQRLEAANAKVQTSNPEIQTLNQEQLKLTREVSELERQVAQARRKKEEAERRARAFQNQNGAGQNRNDGATRTLLNNKLREAESAKSAAEAVNASSLAPDKYNRAANTLKSVQSLFNSSSKASDDMVAEVNQAIQLFQQAKQEAEPKYKEEQEKANPAVRRQKLRSDAEAAFGGAYVMPEPAGSRVVLASLFERGSATVNPNSTGLLEQLAKLATKYDDFNISIEGYTSRQGDATDNLGLSQLRAKAVRDYLTSNGVNGSRIETRGQGQDRPRYPGAPAKNERVEVIFSR